MESPDSSSPEWGVSLGNWLRWPLCLEKCGEEGILGKGIHRGNCGDFGDLRVPLLSYSV